MENFDVFCIDSSEARRLLINRYQHLDFRWRWNDSHNTGIPLHVLNDFARSGEIETKYIPILYQSVFGDKSIEEIERRF